MSKMIASIERGLDRMLTSPTSRIRAMRRELEREETAHQHRVQVRSTELRETLNMTVKYLRNLPSS